MEKDRKLHWNHNQKENIGRMGRRKQTWTLSHMRKFLSELNKMFKFKKLYLLRLHFFHRIDWKMNRATIRYIQCSSQTLSFIELIFIFHFKYFVCFCSSIFSEEKRNINCRKWENNERCVLRNILIESI